MKFELVDFKRIEDGRGKLVVFEENNNCPFEVKRAFFMYENRTKAVRGAHANKESQFLLIPVKGSCKVQIDDGHNRTIFELNTPTNGLFIGRMVWKEMFDFSQDCVLLALSDRKYDPTEYIRNFDEFLAHF